MNSCQLSRFVQGEWNSNVFENSRAAAKPKTFEERLTVNCQLTTAYLPPVQYFAAIFCADEVSIEACENYQKQTLRNRCRILAANGPLDLVVPVCHTGAPQNIRDVRISDHNRWREVHWNALVSAYKNSPYFEFYADDFRPFYEQTPPLLFDLNLGLIRLICKLLDINTPITLTQSYAGETSTVNCQPSTVNYYQVFAHKFGFTPGLSIVDLLFNMGPESRIVLSKLK